ncbi:MAG: hypothetical protein S0880_10385 [Actinomycetota bacterium]|nr:hypothetical protein [Actinomycetota bacterium]
MTTDQPTARLRRALSALGLGAGDEFEPLLDDIDTRAAAGTAAMEQARTRAGRLEARVNELEAQIVEADELVAALESQIARHG